MSIENRFNLIDEKWIPVVDEGLVSLKQLFSAPNYRALGGNPVQKIALTKLLLAIAQAAYTPVDDDDWAKLGADGMAQKCLEYLEKWHDRFWLYGERPFLQMPGVAQAVVQSFGAVLPEVATGNATVMTERQIEKEIDDADKALLIVCLMGFGLGGKKTDNSVVLSQGYQGKSNDRGKASTGKAGTSIGFMGFMHSFLLGASFLETLWFNLFTEEQINGFRVYTEGLGIAPWEDMPVGEDCEIAKKLRNSLMGRLLPISKFCLLGKKDIHYSDGITHPGYKEGSVDPSVAVDFSAKVSKVLWVNPEQRPWRHLPALLSFIVHSNQNTGFSCAQIRFCLARARQQTNILGVWSGGLRVSSNAGEQYVSGDDDFVESTVMLNSAYLGETWFEQLKYEMNELDALSKVVYGATTGYFKSQNSEQTLGKKQANLASNLYWQLCERKFQELVNVCGIASFPEQKIVLQKMHKTFASFVRKAYDNFCPKDTARQLDAWAKNRPNLSKYLKEAYD